MFPKSMINYHNRLLFDNKRNKVLIRVSTWIDIKNIMIIKEASNKRPCRV